MTRFATSTARKIGFVPMGADCHVSKNASALRLATFYPAGLLHQAAHYYKLALEQPLPISDHNVSKLSLFSS